MIDSQGHVPAHTGSKCIPMAGHHVGSGYSVQANLMLDDKVWPAMSRAFESAEGDLAERMLVALEAAQTAGGDIRGKQSAALVVVSGKPTGKPWEDRRFDLRVDDHPEPVAELRRLVKFQRAYNLMNEGDLAVERKDHEEALRAYGGAEAQVPGNAEMIFWHAVALVNMKRVDERSAFRQGIPDGSELEDAHAEARGGRLASRRPGCPEEDFGRSRSAVRDGQMSSQALESAPILIRLVLQNDFRRQTF